MNLILNIVRALLAIGGVLIGVYSTNYPSGSQMRVTLFLAMIGIFALVLVSSALTGGHELPGGDDEK